MNSQRIKQQPTWWLEIASASSTESMIPMKSTFLIRHQASLETASDLTFPRAIPATDQIQFTTEEFNLFYSKRMCL